MIQNSLSVFLSYFIFVSSRLTFPDALELILYDYVLQTLPNQNAPIELIIFVILSS